jgi:hypothetical protein
MTLSRAGLAPQAASGYRNVLGQWLFYLVTYLREIPKPCAASVTWKQQELLEGRRANRIALSGSCGTMDLWLDVQTHRMLRGEVIVRRVAHDAAAITTEPSNAPGRPATVKVLLSDYRVRDGVSLPFQMTYVLEDRWHRIDLHTVEVTR